jgi:methylthioribose-1-phosphate isomerase
MKWGGTALNMLDQRQLPHHEVWLELTTWEQVRDAIRDMAVRGAPAIGLAAAYGMALAAQAGADRGLARQALLESRPTAVNLAWALSRSDGHGWNLDDQLANAENLRKEDLEQNLAIGRFGADLVPSGASILTICNTGSLATAGHGTALGIIRTAFTDGKVKNVFACETRPRQQGLKLTAWELAKDGIPYQVVVEGSIATLMANHMVDFVVAGADRIAANGDTANKIGTFTLAVVAKQFGIPFVIAATSSTIDRAMANGKGIPIEERAAGEIVHPAGFEGCSVWNPAFDVTPCEFISAIVTENGVARPHYDFS